jgi:short-subunit dehydrogenase
MHIVKGKTAIVTGAAGGIGTATARLLDSRGVNLVLADIDMPGLERTAQGLALKPLLVHCDITSLDEVQHLMAEAQKSYPTIDILVNNVGIIIPALFEQATYADIEKQVRINLLGTITCTREVIPLLKKNGGGHIVTVSSLAGIVPETYSSIYTATKFALRGLNLTLNLELKRHCIAVSTIFPDSVDTPMLRYEATHGGSPLTFLSPPQEPAAVAKAILRAITQNKVEQYVPTSTGIFSKIIMCWPWAVTKLWPLLEKSGEKQKKKYQERLLQKER